MSLADCFKKLKLDKKVESQINKDIKKLVKKGMSLSEAEQSVIDSHIEQTRSEVESVREKLDGDFAPVEFKVDEAKTFNQSRTRREAGDQTEQTKYKLPSDFVPVSIEEKEGGFSYNQESLAKHLETVFHFEQKVDHINGNVSVNQSAVGKIASFIMKEISQNPKERNKYLSVAENLPSILKNAIYFETSKDTKDKNDRGDFKYMVAQVNINGKENIVEFQVSGKSRELYNFKVFDVTGWNKADERAKTDSNPNPSFAAAILPSTDSLSDFRKKINSAKRNPLFQEVSDIKRGSIEFSKSERIIRLFKDADKSTFLHEMGHLFLQDRYEHVLSGDASDKALRDWAKLAKWLDYNPAQTELTVEQHEKWARGFETYLMEGKAPIKELQNTFGKFRKWLTRIYKTTKALDAELNPEIRDIMDRMLATEDEIAIARKKSGLDMNIDLTDIPDAVKAKLADIRLMVEESAFAKLYKDQMREMSQEHKEFIKEKRKEVTLQVKAEIEASPEGQEILDIKEALKKKDIWKEAEQFVTGEMDEDKAVAFELLGEEMGYSSGDHFAKAIKEMIPLEQQIKDETAVRMKEFDNLSDKDVIRENAMRIIHNDKSVELLGLEKEIFRKRLLEETEKESAKVIQAMETANNVVVMAYLNKAIQFEANKGQQKFEKELSRLSQRESERRAREDQKRILKEYLDAKDEHERKAKIKEFRDSVNSLNRVITGYTKSEAESVKARAKEILAQKPVKEAGRFTQYFTAERNAALRVAKAVGNGDWSAAIQAKQEQMLNHALVKESIRVKRRSDNQFKYLREMRTMRKDLWKHEDHFTQAAKILDRFGFTRNDHEAIVPGETLDAWAQRQAETGYSVNVEEWIFDENVRIDPSAITTEQLEDVTNAIKNIRAIANMEDRSFAMDQTKNLDLIQDELLAESATNVRPKNRIVLEIYPTLVSKYSDKVSKYFNSLKTIETILLKFDGYKENGAWQKYFLKTIHAAAGVESTMVHEMNGKMDKLYTDHYSKKELKEFKNKKVFSESLNRSVTKETLISMALNMGNSINKGKLFNTPGIGFDANAWGEAQINKALQDNLTESDWQFIQKSWDLIESYWPAISKMETELAGFAPPKIKAEKFTVYTKDGKGIEMAGGYYPLKADTRASFEAERQVVTDQPLSKMAAPPKRAATSTGHTKGRTKAQYALRLDLGVMNEHLYNVIHDLSFRPAIIDMNRILGRAAIQNDVRSVEGANGFALIKQWAVAIGGQDPDHIPAGDAITSAMKSIRTSTTKYMLAINIKNVIQNLANISLYGGSVEGFGHADAFKAVLKSIPAQLQILKGERPLHDFAQEKSSFMRDRSQAPEFSLKEMADTHFEGHSHLARISQNLMAFTDNMTAEPVWAEAYHKKINEGASEKDAIYFADTVVKRAIGSGRRYDQASIYRSGEAVKVFTMFTSFMNTQYNNWSRETGKQLHEKDLTRALTFLGSQFIFVIASGILTGKIGMGDDDEKEKEVVQSSIREVTSYGMGFFPVLRDVGPMITDRLIWDRPGTYRASPAFEIFNSTINATNAIGSKTLPGKRKLEAVAKVPLLLTGTPKQFSDWFWNAYDVAEGMEPRASDLMKRRPMRER